MKETRLEVEDTMDDISFTTENGRFKVRVAGIIIEDNKVLFAKNKRDNSYYLPGGRVQLLESTKDAIRREILEELSVSAESEKLLFVTEGRAERSYPSEPTHEINFYYLIKNFDKDAFQKCQEEDAGIKECFFWLPINELEDYKINPNFLLSKIRNFSGSAEHLDLFSS